MKKLGTSLGAFGTLVFAASVLDGCSKLSEDCDFNLTCVEYGDGDGDGDGELGGGSGDGDGDTGGTGGDASNPCDACAAPTAACNADNECVECWAEDTTACGEDAVCDEENEACVGCVTNDHCTEADASLCDAGECTNCTEHEDCEHLTVTPLCNADAGVCVQCLPAEDDRESDEDACGTNVCNPETYECDSGLTQMGKDACEPCIADAECKANYNCVPMAFKGDQRTGGWCLRTLASGACAQNPYRSPTTARASLSGEPAQVYCSINEMLATCEAVLDLEADKNCAGPEECGAPGLDDGLCEEVSTVSGKCTYECSGDAAECRPSGRGSTCAGDAAGAAGSYCGGMN